MNGAPSLFLSHSHEDKRAARRLARELRAYGFRIWIDEAELRLGAVLSPALQAHIEELDVLIVVASAASAKSTWVALEVAHAVEHGKPVVPFYLTPVATAEAFKDHLGIDATSPFGFVDAVRRLMGGLLPPGVPMLLEPDPAIVEAGLRAAASEDPALRPLIEEYLDGGEDRVPQSALDDAAFHPLDYALHALVELKRRESVAYLAAAAFRDRGAGVAAMSRWIEISGDGGLPLVLGVGDPVKAELLGAAIELLRSCQPPNNHALYQFIHHNSGQFSPAQRATMLSLVVWPERGPEKLGDVLGSVALSHFPSSPDVLQMWTRWIWHGDFDSGTECGPLILARQLAIGERRNVPGLDQLYLALRNHVRSYLRSGDETKVVLAIDHLRANAEENTGALAALCEEASGVSATAEWKEWAKREPKRAEVMAHYVFAFLSQAESDKNWLQAVEDCRQAIEFDELRRRLLREDQA